ncbi:MAG: stage II sporulation protein M, partial [Zoogloeaceae bacterium]|nr:stage II sporulation protein M [Zoogloeaceae bacterium]
MYAPETQRLGALASAAADGQLAMLMYYIGHNVQIDFQCFAGGILFGLGSVFYLVFNGLTLGMVAGHLTEVGYVNTFWGFVAGHSAPELIGAVLSGAAGLKIGYALIAPGRRRRREALTEAARDAVRLLYGAA